MCCTLRVFIFAYSLVSAVVVVALISLVNVTTQNNYATILPEKPTN